MRTWMLSLKETTSSNDGVKSDAHIIWAGNKLPKYLWDHWKNDLKPLGINWQKFMRILRHRTDVGVMWYQGTLPWVDFVQKVTGLIKGPIGKEASKPLPASGLDLVPQDIGALQIPAFSDWEPFERFCRDLWSRIWNNPELQRNGRAGQRQAGVDVYGDINKQFGNIGGVQCKKRDAYADDSLKPSELQQIVEDAKKFTPALREFVVAYTGKSDTALQAEARRLTALNIAQGFFSVRVCSWDDIRDLLGNYPELSVQYNLIATGVSAKVIGDVKRTSDSILELQIEQSADTKDIAQGVSSLRNDVNAVGELVKSIADGGDLTGEYSSEVDEIRDLINASRPKEALDRIEALEKRLKPNITNLIKFRITTNKAAALASIGEDEKAGMLFIEAFQFNPQDDKALCNKALGYLFVEQREEAFKIVEDILQKNPLNQRANELLAYTAPQATTLQSIIDRIPKVLRRNESVAYAIAHAAREREMEAEILHWLEIAVDNSDPKKPTPDLRATLATTILQSFEKRYDVQLGMQITLADKKQLERALALLNDAIGTLENSETLKYRTNWIGNRAVAHKLLGYPEKALADTELAMKLEPDNAGFSRQKAFLLYEQGKSDEAITIFKQILGNPKVPEVALLLAGVFHERKEDDSAIKVLEESVKDTEKPTELLSEEKRLLIHSYMRKGQLDQARKLIDELRVTNPGSVTDLVIAARIEKRANNLNAHNQLLNDARTYVADDTPLRSLFELADELYASKRYADAWPLYEKLVDPRSGSMLASKLIYSYYEAEMYEKALEAARSVPEKEKTRFIYDIEVSILDSMGDIKNAIITSEKYLSEHSEDLAFKVKWATYLLRSDQLEKLDAFLKEPVDLAQLPDDLKFDATRQLAWLYTQRNMSIKALEVAYILRKNAPRNGDAHATYMGIFFDREKALDNQFSPSIVGVDTAVAVEEAGSPKHWYVIEEDPTNDKDALTPNDPLAKKLLGKKVNDEIVQDVGSPSETRLKIVEIKSKYVHALHETTAALPYLFSEKDNPPIKRFRVTNNPNETEETRNQLMQVLDSTAGRDEHTLRVQKLYEEGKLTIGTFANLIGRDPITVWGGLANNQRIGIRCCTGTLEERQGAIKVIREAKSVAVDLTALLTLGSMDRLSLLQHSFEEILVAQSTIDILTQEIAQKNGIGSKGFMTVWKEGTQYFRQEVTAEDIQKQITFLQKIKSWVAEHAMVAPIAEILKLPTEQREELYETIGASFVDTMMIAKEHSCPLYSDDHGTRAIAQNDFSVSGFWTQTLAIVAFEKNLIVTDDLEKVNVSLCELGYRHTTISGATLLYAAKSTGWSNTGVLTTVLAFITGSNIELQSAMGVVVEFFYQLWKEPSLSDLQREALVFGVLDALAQQEDRIKIIRLAGVLLPLRFRLTPIAGNHLLRLITAWRSIRN